MSYQSTRNVRREARTLVGRFRGGKLAPVMAVPVKGNEGGTLSQSITLELDPIAGRMITPIMGELISVFVPVQAIDAIKNPDADFAGLTEVIREKLLSGNPLFGLENEGEISKRCGVNPRSIGGVKKVNEMVRLAHNAAVNYLRTRKYVKDTKLLANSTAITPALISQTVLERMNGVLDPDDRINGSVELDMPAMNMPVTGISLAPSSGDLPDNIGVDPNAVATVQGQQVSNQLTLLITDIDGDPGYNQSKLMFKRQTYDGGLDVKASFAGASAGGVSLLDFYNAEKMDRLTSEMRSLVQNET